MLIDSQDTAVAYHRPPSATVIVSPFTPPAASLHGNASTRVFLDGKATTARIFDFEQPTTPGIWEVGSDGALRLVVFDGPIAKRYRVIPGADSNIDLVLAATK